MHQIEVKVGDFHLSKKMITAIINNHLKEQGSTGCLVEVEVVTTGRIKSLNRKFMGKSCATDVLSFPLERIPGERRAAIGTIVICNDIIKTQAKDQKLSFEVEFAKMLTHGIDHLIGRHHK